MSIKIEPALRYPNYINFVERDFLGHLTNIFSIPLDLESKTPVKNIARRASRLTLHVITPEDVLSKFNTFASDI